MVAEVVDDKGDPVKLGKGFLVLSKPWPSMLRTIYGDPERFAWTAQQIREAMANGQELE